MGELHGTCDMPLTAAPSCGHMDAVRVALLRDVLAGTEWLGTTRRFAGALRASVLPHGSGLLLVGTREYEPWHLAAHLTDEAAWSGTPELAPTLVRHQVRTGAPAHLAVGLDRVTAAKPGETLLVVAPRMPGAGLLERVDDARRAGARVFALDGGPAPDGAADAAADTAAPGGAPADPGAPTPGTPGALAELRAMAHDVLWVPRESGLDLDMVQHLVSAAAGEDCPPRGGRRFRDRLSRLADRLAAPAPRPW